MAKPSPLQVRNLVMAFLAIVVVVWRVAQASPPSTKDAKSANLAPADKGTEKGSKPAPKVKTKAAGKTDSTAGKTEGAAGKAEGTAGKAEGEAAAPKKPAAKPAKPAAK